MFTLANRFNLPAAPAMCFFSGSVGFSETPGLTWHVKLHSESIPIHESEPDPERLAFGIDVRNLQLAVADWRELRGTSVEAPEMSLACAFEVFDWEDLLSLRLSFGETEGGKLQVSAEGVGLVESAPDFFADSQASFSIQTWAQFLGVSIQVPVNAASFTEYAQEKLRTLLPGYAHAEPIVRRGVDDVGHLRGVEVFYAAS
jgi:hypothetical protein